MRKLIALLALTMSALAVAGSSPPSISITSFNGQWNASYDYKQGAVVFFNGQMYIAKKDSPHQSPSEPDKDANGLIWLSMNGSTAPFCQPPQVLDPSNICIDVQPPPTTNFSCPSSPVSASTTQTAPLRYTLATAGGQSCSITGVLSTTGPLMSVWVQVYLPQAITGWNGNTPIYGVNPAIDPFLDIAGQTGCCGPAPNGAVTTDTADYAFTVYTDLNLDVMTDCYGTFVSGQTNSIINPCSNVTLPNPYVWVKVYATTANVNNTPFTLTMSD